jgi:tRNA pseudouridine(55) synthase
MADVQESGKGVHTVVKRTGETPLQCIGRFKAENADFADMPMTYAGRLDPMADGLLLLLSGEAIGEKKKYLAMTKTYECEVLWRFETDSLDLLGLVEPFGKVRLSQTLEEVVAVEKIEENLKNMIGKFEQKYPAYSSRPVQGKPLFQWAREGRLGKIEIPTHEVELRDAALVSRRSVSGQELLARIQEKISLVSGDFRQEEISARWKEILHGSEEREFTLDTISLSVSSGFYVRQFVSDLARQFGTSALASRITRTRIGDFCL